MKCLARNLIVLLALFFFTTFVTDKNTGYYPAGFLLKRLQTTLPVDFLQQSLEGLIPYYDSCLQASVSDDITPGAAMAIIYNGEIRLLKGYGVKKMGTPDPVDIHTAFRIGSVSKGFASVLTGIMARENVIGWDDPVAPYLPDFHHRDPANLQFAYHT